MHLGRDHSPHKVKEKVQDKVNDKVMDKVNCMVNHNSPWQAPLSSQGE